MRNTHDIQYLNTRAVQETIPLSTRVGPIGLVAGAAGAAYATTRTDKIGSVARNVGSTTSNVTTEAVEKVVSQWGDIH